MSTEDSHLEGSDFDDAIDSLLSGEESARPAEESEGADVADPEADGDADSQALSDETLEAIDSVERNAQALIEDAIETLLDDEPESPSGGDVEAEDGSSEDAIEEPPVDDVAAVREEASEPAISAEDLESQLDAIEQGVISEPIVDEELEALAQEVDSLDTETEAADEFEEIAQSLDDLDPKDEDASETAEPVTDSAEKEHPADEAVEDVASMDADELLSSVADELVNASDESTPEPDAAVDEDKQGAQGAVSDSGDGVDAAPGEATDDSATAESAFEETDSFTAAIDELMGESSSGSSVNSGDAPEPDPGVDAADSESVDTASTLADLDAALAGIGDDILSGDFETPEGDLIGSDALGSNDATSILDQLDLGELDLDSNAASPSEEQKAPAEPAASPQAAEVAAEPEPATVPAIPPAPTPVSSKPEPTPVAASMIASKEQENYDAPISEVESIWQTARRVLVRAGRVAWKEGRERAIPFGAKLVVLVNKPVRDRPAVVRDSIGYVALWTTLLAMILWVYLGFVRATPTPTPTEAPTRMLAPGEDTDPLRNASVSP